MLRCIYCGLCEEVCPEEAIVMSEEYDINFSKREHAKFDKKKLLVEANKLKKRLDWLKKFRNPNYGEVYHFNKANNKHSIKDQHLHAH